MSGRERMRCLVVERDRSLHVVERTRPQVVDALDVLVRVSWISANRLDLFAVTGMAFARQQLPLIAGVEGAGVVERVGAAVDSCRPADRVVIYPGVVCGTCRACREGRHNLCSSEPRVRGFDTDGVGAEYVVVPADHLVRVPDGVRLRDAACVPVGAATVEHMLVDNAQLHAGECILVHAGGSGIGSIAIALAKRVGATVITTVGSEEKAEKARALGADHVINYGTQNFSRCARRLTQQRGVDVVFEHVGAATWAGSLRSLALGGRLVICGSHTGVHAQTDLIQLFNRQIRIFASFGGSLGNVQRALRRLRDGDLRITVDAEVEMEEMADVLVRLHERAVFGKVLARMPGWRAGEELRSVQSGGSVASEPLQEKG